MRKINKKLLFVVVFVAIVLLASFLRLWQLDQVPPSLNWDEASWGYNAYSILKTGCDEYGNCFPVILRSFNDYKPALYAYLLLPSISVFGLVDFAVRFPNALFGILTVITTYFLAKELFKRRDIALVSMFIMAVSPWSIQFSRFAHEGTVGLEFNLLMVLFFLKGLRKPALLSFSAFFAALSFYSYQNEKIFVPLLALSLVICFYKELFSVGKKYLASAVVVGLLVSLPIVFLTLGNPEAFTRAKGTSILNNPAGVLNERFYPRRLLEDQKNKDYLGLVLDNRRIVYAKDIIDNYLAHFNPNFLFIMGNPDIGRHQVPGMGQIYLLELPFILIGLYALVFGKFDRRVKKFIVLWILVTPVAASITWDVPNAGRTLNFLPTFQMLSALGVLSFYQFVMNLKKPKLLKYGVVGVVLLFALFNFVYYTNQYFVQYKYANAKDWQYGYSEIIPVVEEEYPNFDKIVVSNRAPLDQSYMFFLYNLKYPPEKYQKISSGNDASEHFFDKFEFRQIKKDENDENTLYIVSPNEIIWETNINTLKEVRQPNGQTNIIIVRGG